MTKYSAGDEFTAEVLNAPVAAYWYSQTAYFNASGTFSKASYPGIRAVRVRVMGGGGGSGGCATTTSTQVSTASGGGGGGYSEKFILAGSLGANETVTVAAGGTAGSAGANNGGTGGTSSFGAHASATGGGPGVGGSATTGANINGGGSGGTGSGGDLNISGSNGFNGMSSPSGSNGIFSAQGHGGTSQMAGMTRCGASNANPGVAGKNYGGGAAGACNLASQTQQAGAIGGAGLVAVDIYL